jgi:hypothetical protein
MVLTGLTLGLLVDSGWYEIDDEGEITLWGKNKKCEFLDSPCDPVTNATSFTEFCSNASDISIDFYRRGTAQCSKSFFD